MGRAKEIVVKVIPAKIANDFVKKHHYSGKVAFGNKVHFGVFLDNALHGVASFGTGIVKRKTIGLVENTGWNDYLELSRLAFDDYLPRNSESRALSVIIKLLKKHSPHVKWLLSYADGTQCGDGTIYRAAGFVLTKIGKNTSIYKLPDGNVVCDLPFEASVIADNGIKKRYGKTGEKASWSAKRFIKYIGGEQLVGHQLRYIYLIDKSCKLTVPTIPFSKIDEMGAGMYKGEKISIAERRKKAAAEETDSGVQPETGGLSPTLPLHIDEVPNGNQD